MPETSRHSWESFADLDGLEEARDSVHKIKRISRDTLYDLQELEPEKSYRLSYLREQFNFKGLDELFERYTERINQGYFSVFLILQFLFSVTHFSIVFGVNLVSQTTESVLPDLILYGITGCLSVGILMMNERYLKHKFYIVRYVGFLMLILVYISDWSVPVYGVYRNDPHLRPAYVTHILIVIFCFLGIASDLLVCTLGLVVTLTHLLTLAFVTYSDYTYFWQRLGSDCIFLLSINVIGLYYRWASELNKRRAFLDHRACVEATLKLTFDKEQEEQLMLSIIPKHTIDKVRKDILRKIEIVERMENIPRSDPMEIPYVQEYDNVTILYADIVNYTAMTTKLPVIKLVDVLNELFTGFDDASEQLNVLRIKFLGDCYYGVAGLPPNPAPNHAEACVDLALKMISIIRIVRANNELDIDMRIGIHSGKILSGLIGLAKWQFDIWSRDVLIANKMETTSEAGKIHITSETRDLLPKHKYKVVKTDRGSTNPLLQPYNVQTFFITPRSVENGRPHEAEQKKKLSVIGEQEAKPNGIVKSASTSNLCDFDVKNDAIFEQRRESLRNNQTPIGTIINRRPSGHPNVGRRITPTDIKRRTAFMDNNINRYKKLLQKTKENMKVAIEEMPFTKFDHWDHIHPIILTFRNLKAEKKYINLPDKLFKYYIVVYILLVLVTIVIQNLTLANWEWRLWFYYGTLSLAIFFLVPLTWASSLFNRRLDRKFKLVNLVSKFLCSASAFITHNTMVRIGIYVVTCGLFLFCVLGELSECADGRKESVGYLPKVAHYHEKLHDYCVIPWHMSQTISLTIFAGFLFLRMYIWLKVLFALSVSIFYALSVWNINPSYYDDSETFNYMIRPQIVHFMSLLFLTFTLHLIDRQSDYLHRLDFLWTEQLAVEQMEVNTMNKITKMLLTNILPVHVAKLYLDVKRNNTNVIYNEEYDNVAVMFASLVNLPVDTVSDKYFLQIVNRIVKDFDRELSNKVRRPIEKIKICNLTYMAACGLETCRTDLVIDDAPQEDVVVSLLKFATNLIKALKKINTETLSECQLKIGISNGKVMGGVVGSKKPLYDIWGDTVNMASRMDSTGVPGMIQVTQDTANTLRENGIECQFRDLVFVKGKEHKVPTYIVSLNNDDDLIYFDSTRL
uniref:adenylate cyclase n=1 Tax=Photinus pyralis TaxID=7054 RepID=A0A1Y1L6S3_PHOPY